MDAPSLEVFKARTEIKQPDHGETIELDDFRKCLPTKAFCESLSLCTDRLMLDERASFWWLKG